MPNGWTSNIVNLLVLAMLPIYIGVHTNLLPASLSAGGIADAGFVSIITLTFVAVVFVTLLTLIFDAHFDSLILPAAASAYVVLIYFLREADMHRLLTVEHVTRGKFYTMPEVPMWQKILFAVVFIILVVAMMYLLFNYARKIFSSVHNKEPWAIALVLWLAVLFISQLCDRSGLNHSHFGRVIEECCECWAAIFMFLTAIQIIPTLKQRMPLNFGVTSYDVMRKKGISS